MRCFQKYNYKLETIQDIPSGMICKRCITCASEADAMGVSSKEAKSSSGGLPSSLVIIWETSE